MTTTTSEYQIHPDFFENKEDCEAFKFRQRQQTNSRYKNFCQTHFTAGDEEQFEEYKFSSKYPIKSLRPSIFSLSSK